MPTSSRITPHSLAATGAALAVGAFCLVVAGAAAAAVPAVGVTQMTSVSPGPSIDPGDLDSTQSVVSRDGRFVAFTSVAGNISPTPNRDQSQVYRRDLVTGTTQLVSVGLTATEAGNRGSSEPSISADGRFVSFTSDAQNLALPAELRPHLQVFVRDMMTGITTLLSKATGLLAAGAGDSSNSSISADGSLVAFQSLATNLVPVIDPGDAEVYVAQNNADPAIRLVSATSGSTVDYADDDAVDPEISADGSVVAFSSPAMNLAGAVRTVPRQVYARTLSTDATELISRDRTSVAPVVGNGDSGSPTVSGDGSVVAYSSRAKNLTADRPVEGTSLQVYAYTRPSRTAVLVSESLVPASLSDGNSVDPSVSDDGDCVAFTSNATNLSTEDARVREDQVYLRKLSLARTTMVTVRLTGPPTGSALGSELPTLSPDGGFVAFQSASSDLTAEDSRSVTETYVRAVGACAGAAPTPSPTPTPTPTVVPPTPTATPPAPTTAPGATAAPGAPATAGAGSPGAAGPNAGHLASTGMSQTPIVIAALTAGVLALVGGSILLGTRAARRKRSAAAEPAAAGPAGPAHGAAVTPNTVSPERPPTPGDPER